METIPAPPRPWRICLFGRLEVAHQGWLHTRFRTLKTGLLLAYLALRPERAHPREALIELLWPECDLAAGRHSLNQALTSLRHQLEPPGTPAGALLQTDRSFVGLNAEAITVDVADFSAILRVAALDPGAARTGLLLRAAELYRGELLPGVTDDWAASPRESLAIQHLDLLQALTATLEAGQDHARALEFALQAVAADPLREAGHAAVMRLYTATGRPDAMLSQYRKLKRILARELGERPSIETQALFRRLNRARAGVPPTLDPGPPGAASGPGGPGAEEARTVAGAPGESTIRCFLAVGLEAPARDLLPPSEPAVPGATAEALLVAALEHSGIEVLRQPDSFIIAFDRTSDALEAVRALEAARTDHDPGRRSGLRIALDAGEVGCDARGYHGRVLECLPLLLLAAHPGQALCSERFALLMPEPFSGALPLVDLGFFRLLESEAAERLFLVPSPGQTLFPLPDARSAHPGNLPLQLTGFFGREAALAWIEGRLEPGAGALLTLTGPGGSGKTRLALEAARRQLEPFRGAVWYVPLTGIDDPEQVILRVADALQIARGPQLDPWTRVVRALQGRPALLVLDNFEQLLPEGTGVVVSLLDRLRGLCCLVTSRMRLELDGEWELPVPPLPTPAGLSDPSMLAGNESVALFMDRARRVQPDFQITAHNAPVLAALCSRLEGIPLALELAAARVATFTPSQLLERMESRLDLLTSRRRDLPARHRTMRAAIDATWQMLDPATQRCFARLSIFRGGWSLEAAAAVTDDPGVLERLETLQACSLITTAEVDGSLRFRMLDTLQEFASEQLDPADRRVCRRRHAAWFAAFAKPFARTLPHPDTAYQRLTAERDNLREAADWALTPDGDPTLSVELGEGLIEYWTWLGAYREGARWFAALLARPALASAPPSDRAKALWRAADLHHRSGDNTRAPEWAGMCVALTADRPEDAIERAFAVNLLGVMATERGAFAEARAHLEESLEILRRAGCPVALSLVLYNLGRLHLTQGDIGPARQRLEESLPYRRQANDLHGTASSLLGLGAGADRWGDFREAFARAGEALDLFRVLGNEPMMAICLNNMGSAATGLGDFATAQRCLEDSLALRRRFGLPADLAKVLVNLGQLARARGEPDAAMARYREALALFLEAETPVETTFALADLAVMIASRGGLERATVLFGAAEQVWREREMQVPAAERVAYGRCLEGLARDLGDEAFAQSRARGASMTLAEAVGEGVGAYLHAREF